MLQHLFLRAGPLDFEASDRGLGPQPHVQPDVARAEIAAIRVDLAELRTAARGDAHFGADPETVALAAARADGEPPIAVAAVVAQQQGRAAAVRDHDIEIA